MAAQRGSPRAASYFHISDNLYIKFDNNDKEGSLGNQWQSLISSQCGCLGAAAALLGEEVHDEEEEE